MYLAVRGGGDTECEQEDRVKADSYITLSQPGPEPRDRNPEDVDSGLVRDKICSSELSVLKVQLREAEETAQKVQRQVRRQQTLAVTRFSTKSVMFLKTHKLHRHLF